MRLFLVSREIETGSNSKKPADAGFTKELTNPPARTNSSSQLSARDSSASHNLTIFILVPDTLAAFSDLRHSTEGKPNIPVIGITGSNGKTIVKEWLYQLLSPDFNIIRSPKSYNSQIGVPISVWKMDPSHQLAIFEAGISQPGEMEKLEKIISPDFGIITNIGHAHDEHFASAIQKTDEKLKLFRNAKLVVYCSDSEVIDNCVKLCDPARTYKPFSWSRSKKADLEIAEVK